MGQVVPLYGSFANPATILRATEGADLIVNLVGVLAEKKAGDFQRLQAEGPGLIARGAAAGGAKRMVQISAIGADSGSPSLYGRTKAAGEQAARAAFAGTTVLRPSLVFGEEDKFFNRFGTMAMYSPIMPVISGDSRFQPVYVGDVADAVMAGLERDDTPGKTFELGGPARLQLSRVAGVDFARNPAASGAHRHSTGDRTFPGTDRRDGARQAIYARPAHHAGAGQRGGRGARRAWRRWASCRPLWS